MRCWFAAAVSLLVLLLIAGCGRDAAPKGNAQAVQRPKQATKETPTDKAAGETTENGAGQAGADQADADRTGTATDGSERLDAAAPSEFTAAYISDDFYAAVVVHPRYLAASPLVKEAGLLELFSELEFIGQFNPQDIEQVVLLAAPLPESVEPVLAEEQPAEEPAPAPEPPAPEPPMLAEEDIPEIDDLFAGLQPETEEADANGFPGAAANLSLAAAPLPTGGGISGLYEVLRALEAKGYAPPSCGYVVRFARPEAATPLIELIQSEGITTQHEDIKYYVDRTGGTPIAVHIADEHTIVAASTEELLIGMLTANEVKTPLTKGLAAVDSTSDLFGVVDLMAVRNDERLRQLLEDNQSLFPIAAKDLITIIDNAKSATFTADLRGQSLVSINLLGDELDSAANLSQIIGGILFKGDSTLNELAKQSSTDDPARATLLELAASVVRRTSARQDADSVIIETQRPANVEELVAKAKPALSAIKNQVIQVREIHYLEQIAVGLQRYFRDYGVLPNNAPMGVFDEPVSWRIKILPFLGASDLYFDYRIDEAWDSEQNRQVLESMPPLYGRMGTTTQIMGFSGEGTLLGNDTPVGLADVTDGPFNTIFCLRTGPDKAVPWTKPEELSIQAADLLESLGEMPADGFDAVLLDGRVVKLPPTIDAATLRAVITPSGGETLDPSLFPLPLEPGSNDASDNIR